MGLEDLTQLHMQAFDRVRRIDDFTDLLRVCDERDHLLPVPLPGRHDTGIFLAPGILSEELELAPRLVGCRGAVYCLQSSRNVPPVLPGAKRERVPQEVDDAGLHRRLRKNGRYCLGEALQPVDHGYQDVTDAAVAQLVHDFEPKLGSLVLFDPEAQDLLLAFGCDAQRKIDGLVSHDGLFPDLYP